MASSVLQLAPLLQPLLAALKNGSLQLDNSSIPSNITISQPGSFEMPTDVSSLISFIYSLGALRDWLKLIVLGGLIELCRRLYYHYYQTFIDQFFITANFESEDMAFAWMMHWLSTLPQWRKVRQFTVSTGNWGLNDSAGVVLEEDDGNSEFTNEERRKHNKVNYLPSMSTSYSLWYKRRWITISHVKEESRWYSDKSTLTVTILSRDRSALDSLILEAKRSYIGALNDKIDIYVNDGFSGDWRHVASRPKRPLKSIILDAGVKELVLDDAKDFLRSKSWYADRGIPFRRGYLLHGAPGSGKTSIIHSLAGELGLDIYIISLSKTGLDDTALNNLICALPEQCIALMEDIDAAFTHGLTRETVGTELEDPRQRARRSERESKDGDEPGSPAEVEQAREPAKGTAGPGNTSGARISLSGLLNALDGVSAQEGRLLFATTNRYSALDPALTRPGRMDLHVEFRLASRYQAREMFRRFYIPNEHVEAKIQEQKEAEKEAVKVSDSGCATPTKEPVVGQLVDVSEPAEKTDDVPNYSGLTHAARAPTLSKEQIEDLAQRFADAIPEREFSMATLQGYLMSYKVRPVQAVEDVARWIVDKEEEAKRRGRFGKAE